MQKFIVFTAILTLCATIQAQTQKVDWSLGYYCGWDQGGFQPASIDWKAFTHISHFAIVPNNDGTLNVGSNGLSDAFCKAAVAEAHNHNVKIVICVGGAGVAGKFTSACSPANIHAFVKNLLDFMRKYGYDGIDTDWEESFTDAELTAWHKELRDSINLITPRPLLTMAGGGYFASHIAAAAQYLDQLNTMSYDVNLGGMTGELRQFTSRGVNAKLVGVGIGIGSGGGMVDVDSNAAKGKVQFALTNGCGGIMQWAVKGSAQHVSIFRSLEQFVPAPTALIWSDGKLRGGESATLAVINRNGAAEIRYSIPASMGGKDMIDLRLYDADGNLAAQLLRGPAAAGEHALSLSAANPALPAGNYFVRLTAGAEARSAMATLSGAN